MVRRCSGESLRETAPLLTVVVLLIALPLVFCGEETVQNRRGDNAQSIETDKRVSKELLLSIPYVDGTRDTSSLSGVIRHEPARAWPGINLFHSTNASRAWLIDMEGEGIWSWSSSREGWDLSHLDRDGSLYALYFNHGIEKLDRESRVIWSLDREFHHALEMGEDGHLYTIEKVPETHPDIHELPIPVDYAVVLDTNGKEVERFSLLDSLLQSGFSQSLPTYEALNPEDTRDAALDFLHTNHIEPIPAGLEGRSPIYREGNLLISFRNIHLVAIIDRDSHDIVWSWGPGELHLQHHPTLLDNGNILIFNNGVEASAVVEIDPVSETVVWRYGADDFRTKTRGSSQRLPNGNTLITESNTGYVFEVTPDGERVWTFANPEMIDTPSGDRLRRAIYRMTRYPEEYATWLDTPGIEPDHRTP